MKLGSRDLAWRPTPFPPARSGLDIALGIGGLPRGRVIEIYGPESSGKTTLALHVVAEIQKKGGIAAYVDAEHALDPVYARKLGVDIDEMLISQPDTGEQALEITDTLVRSGGVDIVVIDSVAALTPKAELEGEMGDPLPGLQARLMSQALRKLTGSISKSNTIVLFINQIRMKIGVMFGNPETTTGGNALKFYASRAPRHPPHRRHQGPRRSGRQPDPREGGQEQGRPALQAGRVRHHVWRGHFQGRASWSIWASRPGSWRNRAPGTPMTAPRIGQGRESRQDLPRPPTPTSPTEIETAIRANAGQIGQNLVLDAVAKRRTPTKNRPQVRHSLGRE